MLSNKDRHCQEYRDSRADFSRTKVIIIGMFHFVIVIYLQWNLSNILGAKIIVLISEMSFFQGENNKGWIQSSVLINLGILIAEVSFERGSTVVLFVFT